MASEAPRQDNPSTFACVLRALRREFFEFDFEYALEEDIAAGPADSLHYYLYSARLKWEQLRMDGNGVPQTWTRTTGTNYWPAYIAWYGLVHLGSYLRGLGLRHVDIFNNQVHWLVGHAQIRADGCAVWPMHFDYPEGGIVLRRPWISAHAQGYVMSALVRAARLNGAQGRLADLIDRSTGVFALDVGHGGVRVMYNGSCFYTEVPGGPVPGILDGFMTSLLGLYDVYKTTNDARTWGLFASGVDGLIRLLPHWDYRGKWSWYGRRERLCPPAYHCLNRLLLNTLGRLTGISEFNSYAQRWHHENLNWLGRREIYLRCIFTQNKLRVLRRTWMHKTISNANGHVPPDERARTQLRR